MVGRVRRRADTPRAVRSQGQGGRTGRRGPRTGGPPRRPRPPPVLPARLRHGREGPRRPRRRRLRADRRARGHDHAGGGGGPGAPGRPRRLRRAGPGRRAQGAARRPGRGGHRTVARARRGGGAVSTGTHGDRRPRALVCGTGFGRVHLAALTAPDPAFELAGILAKGGERSKACANEAGVPLFTRVGDVPDDIDLACVVLLGEVNGGPGSAVAAELMDRGVHVLQEGPLLRDELVAALRAARRNRVVYHVNSHYVHLPPVRRFIAAARALRPLYVEAACGVQVSYHLFDILGRALGGLRPFDLPPPTGRGPFRTIDGTLAGIPFTLRVQNQLHPADPDNHAHLLHRVTIGAEGGTLTLAETHGPVLWSPRPHLPAEARRTTRLADAADPGLDLPATSAIGPAAPPTYREVLASMWPEGAHRAMTRTWRAVSEGSDPLREGQYYLTVSAVWQAMATSLGYPERLSGPPHRPMPADELIAAARTELEESPT
ncbi:thiazolinyl imide reductase [Actinomadura decatromicini]|uniref:Thiazolinyl imide reductase n=1 Tax=Actinomadura decatromicini TaxID=2604572 RepID=A0A5D3F7Y7_9ACTN|nr:thiazolinyl imide reductase [Actinomadura decatromicini]